MLCFSEKQVSLSQGWACLELQAGSGSGGSRFHSLPPLPKGNYPNRAESNDLSVPSEPGTVRLLCNAVAQGSQVCISSLSLLYRDSGPPVTQCLLLQQASGPGCRIFHSPLILAFSLHPLGILQFLCISSRG